MTPEPDPSIHGAPVETIVRWLEHERRMSVATHRADGWPRSIGRMKSVIWIKADAMHAP